MNPSLLPCPCCRFPTLSEHGIHEICRVCWWEDDRQGDDCATEVWGGPNGMYSLSTSTTTVTCSILAKASRW
ncbi:CPCC family cysteine-rich protein [Frigidibacter mobilis]|uniref:CPCC family cysteine-rich protein n=1 Tax=Frigidibacter mobilis TaxID=1335048 RepID=UPI000A0276D7